MDFRPEIQSFLAALRTPLRSLAALGIAMAILTAPLWYWLSQAASPYGSLTSPDGRFTVEARKFRYEVFIPKAIGGGGDAAGKVFLLDRSGRVLQEAPIDLVNMFWSTQWASDSVSLPCVFDWPLPP